jgi:predicted SnoaL-like aldol condensation-catalyzing enzyme
MEGNVTETNKKTVKAFVEAVFMGQDLSVVDQSMRADYIQHNPSVKQGSAGFKELLEGCQV